MSGMRKLILKGVCTAGFACFAGAAVADDSGSSAVEKRDARLEKKIEYRLEKDKVLKKHDLDASVSEGSVTLTGAVASESQKTRAEKVARIKGVKEVTNQIEVNNTANSDPVMVPGTNSNGNGSSGVEGAPAESTGNGAPGSGSTTLPDRPEVIQERTEQRTEERTRINLPSGSGSTSPSGTSPGSGSTSPSDTSLPRSTDRMPPPSPSPAPSPADDRVLPPADDIPRPSTPSPTSPTNPSSPSPSSPTMPAPSSAPGGSDSTGRGGF